MLRKVIYAENLKCKHSNMWFAVLILPILTATIGAIIFGINSKAHLYDGNLWQQLWVQTGLFYGYFFFPILIAICAAYLWRLEHMERNWNRIMIFPFSRNKIFIAKLIVLAKAIFVAQLFLMLLVLFIGKILFGFSQPIPLQIFWWLIMGWFSALSVGAVQLYLSMRIRSFAVPIGISVCLCMVGLVFYTLGFGSVFPYSQIVLGLASQSEELPVENLFTLVPFVIFYVVLFVSLATNYLNTKDIKAN